MVNSSTRLSRSLDTRDAVVIGLASMIGAGIFVAAGPAAAAAGSGLLIGVLLAGCLAYLNASTMAQLAAVYPESGGAYVYGRKQLGHYWGFLAGWGFVIGKIASCTAMALTFAYYANPDHARALSVGIVVLLSLINYLGVRRTASVTKLLVLLVIISLAVVVYASLAGGGAQGARLWDGARVGGPMGILQATGIMFFAFAGYARVATLGEEVIDPATTIPKAILIALGITVVIYIVVIGATVLCVDANALAQTATPLVLAVRSGRLAFLSPVVRVGAGIASIGVLLSMLAGVSRTVFAMAANRDLPLVLSAVHPIYKIPHRAELLVGAIVAAVVSWTDIRSAIGFSSFAVLTYYAIANAAAWSLPKEFRRWPRWMAAAGFIACVTIAFSLPMVSVFGGVTLFTLGSVYFFFVQRCRATKASKK